MKIKYLLLILLIPFFNSCSEDDENEVITFDRKLKKIVSKRYNGDEVYFKNEIFLENNRVTKTDVYYVNNGVDDLWQSYEELYDKNGVNIGSRSFNPDGKQGSEQNYIYDDNNRLVNKTSIDYLSDGTKTDEYEFIYNSDNTITCTFNYSGGSKEEKVFFINNVGLIYKESYYGETYEVELDGNNVISYKGSSYTINYQYDEEHLIAGQFFHTIKKNSYGKMNNGVLRAFELRDAYLVYNDKLLLSESSLGIIDNRFEHEFDEEGYILKAIKHYETNSSGDRDVTEYFYE